jgi:hypothetical protein
MEKVEKGNTAVGLAIDVTEHALERYGGDAGEEAAKWVTKPLGRVAGTGLGAAIHLAAFAAHPTKENAAKIGVFAGKKALLASPFAVVGVVLEVEDIFGVGPESILEYRQRSREAREKTRELKEQTRRMQEAFAADAEARLAAIDAQMALNDLRIQVAQALLDAKIQAAKSTSPRPKPSRSPRFRPPPRRVIHYMSPDECGTSLRR